MTNLFVVDYESFLNQTPSKLCIDAIEDCEIVVEINRFYFKELESSSYIWLSSKIMDFILRYEKCHFPLSRGIYGN